MPSEGLPAIVTRFLRDHIESVEQIEILALVSGAPEREWTARAVDGVLRSSEQSIARRLAAFERAGVLVKVGGSEDAYRFQPKDAELSAAAAACVEVYRARPVLVIETIFKPAEDPAQSFADAFRIRPRPR